MLAPACGRSVATDDKLLLGHALQFDPSSAAPARFVNGITLLADESFQTALLNFRQQRLGFASKLSGEANNLTRRRNQPRQRFLPQSQRQPYQTAAIPLQEIEHV